jgi:hypothetical protein
LRGGPCTAEGGGELIRGVMLTEGLEEARRGDPQPFHEHGADGVYKLGVIVAAPRGTVHSEAATNGWREGDGEGEVLG